MAHTCVPWRSRIMKLLPPQPEVYMQAYVGDLYTGLRKGTSQSVKTAAELKTSAYRSVSSRVKRLVLSQACNGSYSHPAPPPLISTNIFTSPGSSSLPGSSRPHPVTDMATAGSFAGDLARFQQMLVAAMRDPWVQAAILPGPNPSAHGKQDEFTLNIQ